MKKIFFLTFFLLLIKLGSSQAVVDLIIKDVNIITMRGDTLFENKSIGIAKGKIIAITDFPNIKKKSNTKIINAKGKYLMPGLAEMHIHLPVTNNLDTFLTTLVAAGVTQVRIMHSDGDVLMQKKNWELNPMKPTLYFPYELTTETTAKTTTQFDSLFTEVKKKKYDFIKQYSISARKDFDVSVFEAMMISAKKHQLIVCGHYPSKTPIEKVLSSGFKSIEHLGGYTKLTDSKLDSVLELTKKYEVYNCPTLDWDVMAAMLYYPSGYQSRLVFHNAPTHYTDYWDKKMIIDIEKNGKEEIIKHINGYTPTFNRKKVILKKLNSTNNLLLLGGESGEVYQLPGFNMYEEMQLWSSVSISNYEILKAATINAAKFFNIESTYGTVSIGKDADLIILEKNPLKDITNIKTVESTIIKGKVYHKKELLKKI